MVAHTHISPATLVQQQGLKVHPRTLYPVQPRPFDLTPADIPRLVHCVASPKVNGCEAFCMMHAYGTAVLERSGEIHCYPPGPRHLWPALLEGEVLRSSQTQEELVFIAYDCVCSPTLSITPVFCA